MPGASTKLCAIDTLCLVAQVLGQTALVWDGRAEREAALSKRFKSASDTGSTLLSVGDRVSIEDAGHGAWRVLSVEPRRTYLGRPAGGRHGQLQVVAANAEQAIIVSSVADPPFRAGLVDRFSLLARRGGMRPILCVNKIDLAEPGEAERAVAEAAVPLEWLGVSAATGAGIDALRARLTGRETVLVGHSGVGKSSIMRRLFPEEEIATGEVSERNRKGRHTTAGARLHLLPEGGHVIDTPGVRSVILGETDPSEVAGVYPEIADSPPCRFRPCTHRTEPGCSVLAGLESGAISRDVYARYRKLLEEADVP